MTRVLIALATVAGVLGALLLMLGYRPLLSGLLALIALGALWYLARAFGPPGL